MRKDYKFILIILLLFVEAIIYDLLNTEGDISQYLLYCETTFPQYGHLFSFIFNENIQAVLQPIYLGLIPFFIGALFHIHSLTSFFVSAFKYLRNITTIGVFLAGTIPHGIFELPAIIFSAILSVIISKEVTLTFLSLVLNKSFDNPKSVFIKHDTKETIFFVVNSVLFIIVPMVFIGAFIESFLTEQILKFIT